MAVRSSPLAALGATLALLAIATLGRAPEEAPAVVARPAPPRVSGRLDLNLATATELEDLPRVGPALAARIVAHREANGPFRTVEALDEVPGVGPATLSVLRTRVTVSLPQGAAAALPEPQRPR